MQSSTAYIFSHRHLCNAYSWRAHTSKNLYGDWNLFCYFLLIPASVFNNFLPDDQQKILILLKATCFGSLRLPLKGQSRSNKKLQNFPRKQRALREIQLFSCFLFVFLSVFFIFSYSKVFYEQNATFWHALHFTKLCVKLRRTPFTRRCLESSGVFLLLRDCPFNW